MGGVCENIGGRVGTILEIGGVVRPELYKVLGGEFRVRIITKRGHGVKQGNIGK